MEVVIDVKSIPKVMKPTVDDVIVYDGKKWYLTTKDSLLKEANDLVKKANSELARIKEENANFKKEVANQLSTMSKAIKGLYEVKK